MKSGEGSTKYMKLKKKDIRGNYKVKFDMRKKTYPHGYWFTDNDFYGASELELPHELIWWEWNWHFPFLHKKSVVKTIVELQKYINSMLGNYLDKKQ